MGTMANHGKIARRNNFKITMIGISEYEYLFYYLPKNK
jgi:hypothetical protein